MCGESENRLMLIWDSTQPPEDDGLDHLHRVVMTEAAIPDLRCAVEVGVLENRRGITAIVEVVRQ